MRERNKKIFLAAVTIGLAFFFYFAYTLRPMTKGNSFSGAEIKIAAGDGFWRIAAQLAERKIIRSPLAFGIFSLASGAAWHLQAGDYILSSASSTPEIVSALVRGINREVEVTIPPGASIYLVDEILSGAGITSPGEFLNHLLSLATEVEGKLFPDTYRFFLNSPPAVVLQKMTDNFQAKALPILMSQPEKIEENLILASILEKEVPDGKEQRLVAGILNKRLAAGMPLQVDATICYLKQRLRSRYVPCYPLTDADFRVDSPYNTYLYPGLPPTPIGSPGIESIKAAMSPQPSAYWYYLSDPRSRQTIFSREFEEHNKNRAIYLKESPP